MCVCPSAKIFSLLNCIFCHTHHIAPSFSPFGRSLTELTPESSYIKRWQQQNKIIPPLCFKGHKFLWIQKKPLAFQSPYFFTLCPSLRFLPLLFLSFSSHFWWKPWSGLHLSCSAPLLASRQCVVWPLRCCHPGVAVRSQTGSKGEVGGGYLITWQCGKP